MAAGLGTRMRSRRAKVLHSLAGAPLIRYPLATLSALGASPLVVVVGHQAEDVMAACGGFSAVFATQVEPRGTGHAVRCAADAFAGHGGDILILPSDVPLLTTETLRSLVAARRDAGAVLSLLTARVAEPRGYGRVVREAGRVTRIVEDRDATPEVLAIREVNVGVYCVSAPFLFPALERLRPTNAQGELYLTDIVGQAAAKGLVLADAPVAESEVAQVSSREDLAHVERALRQRLTRKWMAAGVTIEDPDTTYIGPEVAIGRDTVIGPNVILRGRTRIGEDCRLDGSALVVDSEVGNRVHLKFSIVINEAHVGNDSTVGPFAQLRPGTHLAAGVHIGDFVETKNAVLGPGVKANHLAYIGDAEIGRETNVGAGTITCNYDGFRKQRTVIGERVMIGSDSQLIAPVTVGDDAYVATGTTVMGDVPPGALVFTKKEQQHRRGWVAARRARQAGATPKASVSPPRKKRAAASPKRRGVTKLAARTPTKKKR